MPYLASWTHRKFRWVDGVDGVDERFLSIGLGGFGDHRPGTLSPGALNLGLSPRSSPLQLILHEAFFPDDKMTNRDQFIDDLLSLRFGVLVAQMRHQIADQL